MRLGPKEFIALSACTMTLTALGIDIMLPALGALREHFGLPADSMDTAQIITFFFMGQIAQIIFGAFSDRYGRLPVLRFGFVLYIIGGLAATFSTTLDLMLASRFLAGMGASAVLMSTVAGVRDRFVGDEMARIMSLVFTIFLFTPILAPFLGLAILSIGSWKMVFLTPPLFAVIVFCWSLRLDESLPVEKRVPLKWSVMAASVKTILTNSVFLRYTGITTVLFTALSTYVSSSEHIVGEIYGKPRLFAWIFGGMGLVMSLSSLLNSRLSTRFGARRSIRGLLVFYTIVGAGLLIYELMAGDPPAMSIFFTAVTLMMAANLAIEPNSSALALEPLGERAGMAAALYGTIFFFFGSTLSSFISRLMVKGVFPLVLGFFVLGLLGTILGLSDRRPLLRPQR